MVNGADPMLHKPAQKFPTIYPLINAIFEPHEYSAGQFIGSRPLGVTVHTTADDQLDRARRTLKERHLGYHLIIDYNGRVTQICYLDRRTNHAGPSEWRGLSCNAHFAAVALLGWGQLTNDWKSWTGSPVIGGVRRPANIGSPDSLYNWQPATAAQEQTLRQVLGWFVALGVDPANFCGHDEAAIPPGRKTDPGGALAKRMSEIRLEFGAKL